MLLSREDVEFFKTHGYLVLENLFTADDLSPVNQVISEWVEHGKALEESDEVIDLEDTHTPEKPRIRRIKRPYQNHQVFRDFVRRPDYMGVISSLIGPNIRLHTSKLNLKLGGFGAPVQWHQDWAFYPHTNDDVLVSGVILDDMVEDNGPLLVIPGSQKGPVFDHHHDGCFIGAFDTEASGLDFSKAVKLTAPTGSLVVFHSRIVHGSELNRSELPRRVLYYELTAADAWPLGGTYSMPLIPDLDTYNGLIVAGEPTLEPRLEKVPVRIPLPVPEGPQGIYILQKQMRKPAFESSGNG